MHEWLVGRPKLPQISLDLVEVEGGGCVPSQFWGRTADGSYVYIRYRGAWLSIHKGQSEDVGMRDDQDLMFKARIGPGLHGMITLEQVSDLTGLTVRRERLNLSEHEFRRRALRDHVVDFSGRRLYVDLNPWARDEDLAAFLEAARKETGAASLLTRSFSDGRFRYHHVEAPPQDMSADVMLVVGCDPAQAREIAAMDYVPVFFLEDKFDLVLSVRRIGMAYSERFPKKLVGNYEEVEIAPGARRCIGIAHGQSSWVSGHFEVSRTKSVQLAHAILSLAGCIFISECQEIDLVTGEATRVDRSRMPFGLSMAEWCREKDDRYLSWTNRDRIHAVGLRPA